MVLAGEGVEKPAGGEDLLARPGIQVPRSETGRRVKGWFKICDVLLREHLKT